MKRIPRESDACKVITNNLGYLEMAGNEKSYIFPRLQQVVAQTEVAKKIYLEPPLAPINRKSILNCEKKLDKLYGMEPAKEHLLALLAAQAFTEKVKTIPLILVGPPGVGKSCLALAASNGLNRSSINMALGSSVDYHYLKGSPVIYMGSGPGVIGQGFHKHGKNSCWFSMKSTSCRLRARAAI